MRCSEIRRRLIESHGTVSANDGELRQHLLTCSDCAAFARAEQSLCRDLATAAVDDNTDDIPLSALKTRVEARVQAIHSAKTKEILVMSALIKQVKRRPSLGVTIGFAVIVLALVTFIPFSFDNTVGYEVAIAGVNKDLAMDNEKINDLMAALGLENANVDVGDCESTCILKISDLSTSGDVEVIVAAFDELGHCELKDIQEIIDSESMTILEKAHKNMFIKTVTDHDGEEVHEIVINALCHLDSVNEGMFNIWITDDADTIICQQGSDSDGRNVIMYQTDCEPGELGNWSGATSITSIEELEKGHTQIYITGDDGEQRLLNLDDPDIEEHLEKLGINITDLGSVGKMHGMFISDDSCVTRLDEYLCNGDSDKIIIKKFGDCTGAEESGSKQCIIDMKCTEDGDNIVVVDDDGELHKINLNDPDAVAQLEALGFDVKVTFNEDGGIQTIRCMKDGDMVKVKNDDSQFDEAEMKETPDAALPDGFELKQNYPNPFNPTTIIKFSIPENQDVLLEVFNVSGQKIRTLLDAVVAAGELSVEWDATDDNGGKVASGIYMYRLTTGDFTTSKKMTLLK